jgi:hypothetical protein
MTILTTDTGPDDVRHVPPDDTTVVEMSDARAQALADYIRSIADRLGLGHWTVFLGSEPAEEHARAQVQPVEGRYVASIHVQADWWDSAPHERRNDIVHELLHLAHRDQTDVIRVGLLRSGFLSEAAGNMVWSLFATETERMVDHLTGVLAPEMPWVEDPDAGADR